MRLWFGHGADGWKAVERARCKMAVQRMLLKGPCLAGTSQAAAHDLALVQDAALDYFFTSMLLAVTSHFEEEDTCHREGSTEMEDVIVSADDDDGGGDVVVVGGDVVDIEGETHMGKKAFGVCIQVAKVRRGCGVVSADCVPVLFFCPLCAYPRDSASIYRPICVGLSLCFCQ